MRAVASAVPPGAVGTRILTGLCRPRRLRLARDGAPPAGMQQPQRWLEAWTFSQIFAARSRDVYVPTLMLLSLDDLCPERHPFDDRLAAIAPASGAAPRPGIC